jgi:hypothetical protein
VLSDGCCKFHLIADGARLVCGKATAQLQGKFCEGETADLEATGQVKFYYKHITTLLAPPCAVVTKCNSNDRVPTGSSVVQGKETTVKSMWVSTESRKRAALHARPPAMSRQTVK